MEKISLENFKKNIDNIREYIKHINLVNQVEEENQNIETNSSIQSFVKHFHNFKTEKKLFEYKAIIISLYGLLENTISQWIQEHINNISYIVGDYSTLNKNFKKEHFNRSIKLIDLINEKRYSKFENIPKEDILQRLSQAITNPNNFKLNSEAYIPLSGNLKHIKVVEAFKPLNINLDIFENTLHREIIKIDDLVTRRNDIAHGVNIDNAILDTTILQDYINDLETYITSLFKILSAKEVEYAFEHQSKIYIGETTEVFEKGTVCIVKIKDIEIKVGDTLFIEKANKALIATILNIQKDDISVESANDGELGLLLNISIKKNSKIWKKECNK